MANIFGAGGGGTTNIFSSSSATTLSILSAARSFYKGIGLSARARAMSDDYLNQSVSGLNTILSLNVSVNADINSVQQKILAIRASIPQSQIAEDLRDNGNAAADPNGTNVDEEA